ncbi:MAG: DNA mismatch repair protein MutS [Nitrososphaerota archaeon]|jgi:DNA mismatch repair ATPase MutS|nr:DNA mismatch repair protein MutS [Nitrososphaerota archaeon]MDG6927280.1 DNA mismatch repair protein MutS [Nitrososphaerota archaeon]MDG6930362.1 DNA mismatch repair protein MutS [Nitrososphaerota archaeon]MDG6931718.1 DNA mismatch repair protein MutS [Nitrososphaerota archaeon]MDG6936766.1 DNA mismatch repair protein MutS [Nitrososphaerota archaeon]
MAFKSILWTEDGTFSNEHNFFADLNLEQVINEITKGDQELKQLFYLPLKSSTSIAYRQKIFEDLENSKTLNSIMAFYTKIEKIDKQLQYLDKLYDYQREGVFIETVISYCNALIDLAADLSNAPLKSTGLADFRDFLKTYLESHEFTVLKINAEKIRSSISSIKFIITINGGRITVKKYNGENGYNNEIVSAFSKFGVREVNGTPEVRNNFNHIEANILKLLANIYINEFYTLKEFYKQNKNFIDQIIYKFYKEVRFYLFFIDYITPLKLGGLSFCLPQIDPNCEKVFGKEMFDFVLAKKLIKENKKIVTNDFYLDERIVVITGPNSGGKTTFARAFGQMHAFGRLGLPVPGRAASLCLCDHIFTHFEIVERVENLTGKFEDDLVRIRQIIDKSTEKSVLIINEMLSSTSIYDAKVIGKQILEIIKGKGAICVYVTFIDDLAKIKGVLSMVAQVDPNDPSIRTYKIVVQEASSKAYTDVLARKYGLSKEMVLRRLKA